MEGFKMSKDLSYKPLGEPICAEVFKVVIRETEYVFDDMESAKQFKNGYNKGITGLEPMSRTKMYKDGYRTGINDLARGAKKRNYE